MLYFASPQLRMDTIFTSGVSCVFAFFTVAQEWPDLPASHLSTSYDAYANVGCRRVKNYAYWHASSLVQYCEVLILYVSVPFGS